MTREVTCRYGTIETQIRDGVIGLLLRSPAERCAVDLTAKEAREVAELLAKAANLSDGREERKHG